MSLLHRLLATRTNSEPDVRRSRVAAQVVQNVGDDRTGYANDRDVRAQLVADASALAAAGRYGESLALVVRALVAMPDDPDLLFARASTLYAWGRFREARDGSMRAEAMGLQNAALYLTLGWSCLLTGNPGAAEEWMHKATAVEPDSWMAHFGLATVFRAQKRVDEAIVAYERALNLRPDNIDCLNNLVVCRLDQGDPVAAEAQARRVIAVDARQAVAWANLGVALARQRKHAEAVEPFERAQRLETDNGEDIDSFVNAANNLRDVGRTEDALQLYERNLAQRPSLDGYGEYALTLLTAGRLAEGWSYYECRWSKEPFLSLRPGFHTPVWAGQDLRGKTILLRAEQGFGDSIQFIRYVPQVKALGATVLLQIREGLEELASGVPGIDRILKPGESLPAFDFYIHLMSLPHVFGTDLSSIPADIPYLYAEPARVKRWEKRVAADGSLKVGLVWGGDPAHTRDQYRSMSLRTLAPIWDLEGLRFYSLQKGSAAAELETLPKGMAITDLGAHLENFSDSAAVISQLDLMVCVDTAPAHLAGALGKPVWLMLPRPADFRWLEERDDSPWYPTMRLFRQKQFGTWDELIDRVKAALQERLREDNSVTMPLATQLPKTIPMFASRSPSSAPAPPVVRRPGFSAVAETRVGILQYLPDDTIVGDSIDWYGELLQPQLSLLARIIRPGATVMEVGAGIGAHSLFLAETMGAAGHLFLYESRPVMQRILRQNLAANRITNVTAMKGALGRPNRPAPEAREGPDFGGHTILENHPPTETLDELLLDRLDWLKINDGSIALQVLEGATDTLWRLRPAMFITAGDEAMLTALKNRALGFSYRCWRMETAFFNAENFNRRDTDVFSGRTALALLAIPEEIDVGVVLEGCVELG
jgi:FkbM family methyltransferase